MKIHWFFKVLIVLTTIFIIWVIFYLILPQILPVQKLTNTEVYGLIFSDQVWEGEVRVVGDIYSPTNSTVTILPGTKVYVSIKGDKSNLDLLPWHKKSGVNTAEDYKGVRKGEPFWDETEKIQIHLNNLIIPGEFNRKVIISSDSIQPSPYDFNIIEIKSGRINHAVFSNYRRFETGSDVVISDSVFRDTGECSICFTKGQPRIQNSTFEKSIRESIWVEKASPEIFNNFFINLSGDGIKIDAKRLSVPIITGNTFEMPQGVALNIISGGQLEEGLISQNFFAGNSLIKIACDSKLKIRDNIILGLISFSSGCGGGFTFGPNYWGTSDSRIVMREKILNKNNSYDIQIPSVLLSPPKEAGKK